MEDATENEKEYDEWELALDNPLDILKKCQIEKNINSCLKCTEILTCKIRDNYIKAVYESMNKGSGGGFEF